MLFVFKFDMEHILARIMKTFNDRVGKNWKEIAKGHRDKENGNLKTIDSRKQQQE